MMNLMFYIIQLSLIFIILSTFFKYFFTKIQLEDIWNLEHYVYITNNMNLK